MEWRERSSGSGRKTEVEEHPVRGNAEASADERSGEVGG